MLVPYGLLVLLSLGSGWSFPHLLPDRLDGAPWRHFIADRNAMLHAVAMSAVMSLAVATLSTIGGILVGRALRRVRSDLWRFLACLPFVVSPVVVGVCLYDLLIRMRLAGTVGGVILLQTVFALGFASMLFSEMWTPRTDRFEQLVRTLGGNTAAVWRHAILPQISGLIAICFVQTALYSWLDYGLVSVIGGGHVSTVTTKLFGYLREASVNQAAQAGLVLLAPTLLAFAVTAAASATAAGRSTEEIAR